MRYNCEVDGCRSQKTNEKLSFFTLPRDEGRRKKWLDLIGRPDLLNKKLSCHFVCSLHFDKTLIKYKPQLHADALPSKCLPSKSGSSSGDTDEDNVDKSTQTDISVNDRKESLCVQTSQDNPKNNSEQIKQTKAVGSVKDQKDQLIAKVYHYFEQEYEELKRTIPGIEQSALAQLRQRTARATGVSETAVADVLAEEARRNEVRVKEEKRRSKEPLLVERKTRIRSMQDESSGEECNYYSSDEDNDDRFEATETLVIKEEPLEPEYEDPAEPAFLNLPSVKEEPASSEDPKELVDPIAINIKKEPGVKTEPNEEEATTSNGLTGATTSIKKRKIKTEAPPATSSSPTTSSTPKRRLVQIKDIKVKVEKEEIKEEGDS